MLNNKIKDDDNIIITTIIANDKIKNKLQKINKNINIIELKNIIYS
jgi:16S rRNA C967 or C1407 C5-methylase (RsmB/RsmF family)